MTTTKKRPEVLVPAGTLEKLKVAVNYGADAVFVGGQAYGLRSRAGNFTMDELRDVVTLFNIAMELWGVLICIVCAGGVYVGAPIRRTASPVSARMRPARTACTAS